MLEIMICLETEGMLSDLTQVAQSPDILEISSAEPWNNSAFPGVKIYDGWLIAAATQLTKYVPGTRPRKHAARVVVSAKGAQRWAWKSRASRAAQWLR